MANCCGVQESGNTTPGERCPRSGAWGKRVDRQTVKALLTAPALGRLEPGDFWFCPDPGCDIVYFSDRDSCFSVTDIRVAVWQKEPFGRRQVCYCFGESEDGIRSELASRGQSSAAGRVREHIAADRCACEIRNPRGVCCLGDVMAAVERVSRACDTAGARVAPREQSQADENR